MRGRSTKLWELERAEARGGSKLNNIFSSSTLDKTDNDIHKKSIDRLKCFLIGKIVKQEG